MTLYWVALLVITFLILISVLAAKTWQLRELLEQHQRVYKPYRVLWDNIPGVVVEVRDDGTIINATSGDAVYGVDSSLIGKRVEDLLAEDMSNVFSASLARAKETGESVDYQIRVRRPDNSEILFNNHLIPILKESHLPTYLIISSDITELARVQAELLSQKEVAELASDAKGRFLASMTHEIRTPLNGMLGMLTMLESTPLNHQQRSHLATLQQASDHLLAIVNDVLDLSKIESGKLELSDDEFDLPELAHRVVGIVHSRAAEKRIAIQLFIEDDVPQKIIGDPLRLSQILINLLTNAIKFTDKGHVIIRIDIKEQNVAPSLHFSVEDTGVGIDSERAKGLFEEYSMVHGNLSVSNGGTGLGLNICKRLVEAMEGRIGVHSSPDVGSCFWFNIPLAIAGKRLNFSDVDVTQYRQRILWVADSFAVNRTLVVAIARKLGVSVRGFDRLRDLLSALQEETPDLLVMSRRFFMAPDMQINLDLLGKTTRVAVSCDENLSDGWQAPADIVHASWSWPVDQRQLVTLFGKLLSDKEVRSAPLTPKDVAPATHAFRPLGLRVLLVEDNIVNQRVVELMLKKQGCEVDVVSNGLLALEYMKTQSHVPDVILMDRHMPIMGGIEATRALRAEARWQSLPIIALSGDVMRAQQEEFLQAGATAYLVKPVQVEDLRHVLVNLKTEHRHVG